MMVRKFLTSATLATLATLAFAGPQTYATNTQTFNAGIVILNSGNPSAAPHAIFNYDNAGIKPAGWTFVNPSAPSRVTAAINARWGANAQIGARISKKEGAYWEVYLSQLSDAQLSNYDFLLLDPVGVTSLLPLERDRLRRFVDHGGILWIDPAGIPSVSGGFLDAGNNFPAPFEIISAPQSNSPQLSDFSNPLMSRPNALSSTDVNLLNTGLTPGGGNPSIYYDLTAPDPFLTSLPGYFGNVTGDYPRIRPVAVVADGATSGVNGSTTIGVMQIGVGYVVVTSRGVSMKLNRVSDGTLSYATNTGYEGETPVLQVDGIAAAKLVTNMLSLGSQVRGPGANSHNSGATSVDLGGPLLQRMSDQSIHFAATVGAGIPVNYGAVVFQGITIVSSNDHLAAYRVDPNSALGGNSDPGEIVPTNPGSGADLLWVSPTLPAPISAPVLADVPNSSAGIPTLVLVTDGNGIVHAYNPVARNADGTLNTAQRLPVWNQGGPGGDGVIYPSAAGAPVTGVNPNAPTVHESLAYIADQVNSNGADHGRIWVINMATGQRMTDGGSDWFLGGETSPFQAPPFTTSATVGYIPILDNSGGQDRVLYVPWTGDQTNGAAGFVSLWIGARGEKPVSAEVSGNTLAVTTRASQQGGLPLYYAPTNSDPLAIHLSVLDVNGNPIPTSQMSTLFSGSPVDAGAGSVNFTLTGTGQTYFTNNTPSVRIDYTIDWSNNPLNNNGVLSSVERGRLQMPDQVGNTTRFLTGPLALSPAGTIYLADSGTAALAGSTAGLFGFQEQGRGNFVCVNRFELYPQYKFATQGSGLDVEQPTVGDNDTIATTMAPQFLFQQMGGFTIIGAPVIRNGQVIIAVTAYKGNDQDNDDLPTTVLMAFQSEPEAAQFTVPSLPDGSVLVQADLVRSTQLNSGTADVPAVLPTANYAYDPNTHLLTIDNLMNTPKGAIQQCLSLSQRLWLRAPGQSDLAIDPDNQSGASRWSPLLWYTVLNGYIPRTGPVITGNSVYIGGSSAILSILNGTYNYNATPQSQGLLYAFKANIAPSDPAFVKTINIPPVNQPGASTIMTTSDAAYQRWNKQVQQLTLSSGGQIVGNPDVEWPQYAGVGSLANYVSRLSQTILPGSTTVQGIAAGDGSLVAQGDGGMYTFDRADFVVADEGRIIMFDPSGNPLWSTSSYADTGAGATGGAGTVHPLVRPTKAYRLNQTDLLVVDSGASTVVRMNMSGLEIRAINGLMLDPKLTPVGYTAGEPNSLSNPRDATTFSTLETITPTSIVSFGDGESGQAYEIWTHYLIADTGNHRLLELVDRNAYNPVAHSTGGAITINGVPQLGVLVWHSPAVVGNKKYDYNSITRSLVPTGAGTTKFVYIAAVGTVMPTQADLGIVQTNAASQREAVGNGGIIVFDPTQPGPLVFNQLSLPSIPANELWVENPVTGVGSFTSAAQGGTTIPMANLSSVSTFVTTADGTPTGAPAILIMISCGSGVYEALYDPNGTGTPSNALGVTWMVPNQVYRVMRLNSGLPTGANPQALQAVYAERLSPNDVVIVNGYYGQTRGGAGFTGEVVQLASSAFNLNAVNLGFNLGSITLQLPPIQGARGIVLPLFADRR